MYSFAANCGLSTMNYEPTHTLILFWPIWKLQIYSFFMFALFVLRRVMPFLSLSCSKFTQGETSCFLQRKKWTFFQLPKRKKFANIIFFHPMTHLSCNVPQPKRRNKWNIWKCKEIWIQNFFFFKSFFSFSYLYLFGEVLKMREINFWHDVLNHNFVLLMYSIHYKCIYLRCVSFIFLI